MTNRWRIELLGGLRVGCGAQPRSPLPYQKATALLAYLVYFSHHPHPREELIELLWPEVDPEAGQRNLRAALHSLRRLLEERDPSASDLVIARRTTIHLEPAAFTTDAAEFHAALQTAARNEALRPRAEALGAAVVLYTGELLPGFFESWVLQEREHLAGSYLEALQQLVRAREELGDPTGALAAARQAIAVDPLREEAHYDVMRLYAATGQPSACLHQYQELERLLREELGETPSAEARALAEELQHSARRLVVARRSPRPEGERGGQGERGGRGEGGTEGQGDARAPAAPLPPSPPPPLSPELPLPLSRFFGREEEIDHLTELLLPVPHPSSSLTHPSRLVTVTGPGGSGKTRLAIALAERLRGPFGEAVAFVPLADLSDAGRLLENIADALGLERSPGDEPWPPLVDLLRRRPWLLVLDNFESLVEIGATQVRILLERARTLTCLITSRRRLGISGEQEFALLPLPTPRAVVLGIRYSVFGKTDPNTEYRTPNTEHLMQYPSVQLFVDRARAVRADFRMTGENAAAVAELCDRLEGLPLAIELAAARAGVLSPAQMLEQLAGRFEFLVSRQRDLPARHRTLRAAIDTSFEALPPPLREFFGRLLVFRGGWTLEAAAAVSDDDGGVRYSVFGVGGPDSDRTPKNEYRIPTLDFLEQLHEASLVIAEETEGALRYRLLETLREYAAARLSEEERNALMDRHLAFFLAMTERIHLARRGPGDLSGVAALQGDYANLQAALAWGLAAEERAVLGLRLAIRLDKLWNRRVTDGRRWLTAALKQAPQASLRLRAEALLISGHLAGRQNDLPSARAALEESLALWRQVGDPQQVADTLVELAACARGESDLAGGQAYLEECIVIRQECGDGEGAAWAQENLAWVVAQRGEIDAATTLLQESLKTGRASGALEIVAYSLHGLGWLTAQKGDLERALPFLEESLGVARELARQPLLITHRSGIQRNREQLGLAPARVMLEYSLAFNRALDHRWLVMHTLGALGHIAREQGDGEGARAYYEESLRLRRELDDSFAVAQALEDLAALTGEQGQAERAICILGAAEALCETLRIRPPVAVPEAYERTVAAARAALGEAAFAAAWAKGRALSVESGLEYALSRG